MPGGNSRESASTISPARQRSRQSGPRAINIPLHELTDRVGELPAGQVWVHCGSGYRASIAASILDRNERDVVLIDDEFGKAEELGLTSDPVD